MCCFTIIFVLIDVFSSYLVVLFVDINKGKSFCFVLKFYIYEKLNLELGLSLSCLQFFNVLNEYFIMQQVEDVYCFRQIKVLVHKNQFCRRELVEIVCLLWLILPTKINPIFN